MKSYFVGRATGLISLAVVSLAVPFAVAQTPIPLPKVAALPATKDSFPFLEADRNLKPYNLAKLGYTEQEFLISGAANVYDWAPDGTLSVKTPNAPYTTRILVRYPSNPARFSGTVVVENLNEARKYDWAMMWGYLGDEIIQRGDAWVGVTMPERSRD